MPWTHFFAGRVNVNLVISKQFNHRLVIRNNCYFFDKIINFNRGKMQEFSSIRIKFHKKNNPVKLNDILNQFF